MVKKTLEVHSEPIDDSTLVITLSGDLLGSSRGYDLQNEVREKVSDGSTKIVVDLSTVDRIDSSGIGILMAMMWSASQAGGNFVLASIPPKVEKVLGIVMLLDHIDHAGSVQEALAKLKSAG
ncbi:MAG: STAS domain-containing protein [Acidobacteriota bacterium]